MDQAQFIDQITSGIEALGQELSPERVQKCAQLLCELDRWGARMNLTAIRKPAEMISTGMPSSKTARVPSVSVLIFRSVTVSAGQKACRC